MTRTASLAKQGSTKLWLSKPNSAGLATPRYALLRHWRARQRQAGL